MILKIFRRGKFTKFYSKNSLEQVCFSLLEANRQCQLSTSRPVSSEKEESLHTSLLPYKIVDKDLAQMYDITPSPNSFEKYEFLFCTLKTSPHYENLIEKEGMPNMLSFSIGQNQFVDEFSKINLYSPRCIFSGSASMIDFKAKDAIWDSEFSHHPNMHKKKDEVAIYQLTSISSPQYVDYGGNMIYLDQRKFKKGKKSEIARKMYEIVKKFNKNITEMDELILKGYNIDCEEKFIFHVDNLGMNVLGKLKSEKNLPTDPRSTEWSEYYLDFGKELDSEEELNDFLFKFHHN